MPPWLPTAPDAPSEYPFERAAATWLAAPTWNASPLPGSCSLWLSGMSPCPPTVMSNGFWSLTVPGFVARASCRSTIDWIGLPPAAPSRKRPTACARGVAAAAGSAVLSSVDADAEAHAPRLRRAPAWRGNGDGPRSSALLKSLGAPPTGRTARLTPRTIETAERLRSGCPGLRHSELHRAQCRGGVLGHDGLRRRDRVEPPVARHRAADAGRSRPCSATAPSPARPAR